MKIGAGCRQSSVTREAKPAGCACEQIWRAVALGLECRRARGESNIVDSFMPGAIVHGHQRYPAGVAFHVPVDTRSDTRGGFNKNRKRQPERNADRARLGRRWNLVEQNPVDRFVILGWLANDNA